jgi:hypothetical protein
MPEIFNVIQSEGIDLANNVRINLGRTGTSATNKTSQSLRIQLRQEGTKFKLQLFGRPFFMTVETGRRPTPDKKPSREMISNIREWVNARGVSEEAVWAIATNIQKKGTELWREGGREDIVEPAVDEFVNNVGQNLLEAEADNFVLKVRELEW